MEPRTVDSGGQAYAVKICPKCGARDSIVYHKATDKQLDLFGRPGDVVTRLRRPECSRCGATFERGEEFKEEKRRL